MLPRFKLANLQPLLRAWPLLLLIVVVVVLVVWPKSEKGLTADGEWTCSMHPQVRMDKPGKCPICGMPLVPVSQLRSRVDRIGVETETVARRELFKEIRAVGKIDYNESRVAHITARIDGRVDRLYVDFTGIDVQQNDHLVDIYSPELVVAQEELLRSLDAFKRAPTGGAGQADQFVKSNLQSVRDKLRLWGILPEQIAEIEKTRKTREHVTLFAPMAGTVIEKNVRAGQYVVEGDLLYRIAELHPIWLYLDIYEYDIDRAAIARYGINIRDVQDVIETAVGGENLTMSVEGRERYPIRVRYPRELRDNFESLERILVPTSTGAHVPIAQVAKIRYTVGPQELKSENGLLVEDAERLLQAEKCRSDELIAAGRAGEATLVVPPGYYWQWGGQFESHRRAMQRLSWLVPLVLLVLLSMFIMIYMGLGHWWMALIVFFGILVSASGGFIMLYFWGANVSVAVWVGFIALFGVVDDAAVVMLDFLQRQFKGFRPNTIKEIRETVIAAALQRFRPMLMSMATTVIGLMPVLMVAGRGSDVMQPMAIPSVGGMAVQIITLFIAPCLFCLVMEWRFHHGGPRAPDGEL